MELEKKLHGSWQTLKNKNKKRVEEQKKKK